MIAKCAILALAPLSLLRGPSLTKVHIIDKKSVIDTIGVDASKDRTACL